MKKNVFGTVVFVVAALIVAIVFVFKQKDIFHFNRSSLPVKSKVQAFSFVNQDGKAYTNAEMKGKVCVVNYFFTTCRTICPVMNNNMKLVYNAFVSEPDVLILSHSSDPQNDSVPVMKHYADSLKVDTQKWVFLTGRKDSLYKMARYSYGIDDPANAVDDINDDFVHTQLFALVDKEGNVRGIYDGLNTNKDIPQLINDIKSLLKE